MLFHAAGDLDPVRCLAGCYSPFDVETSPGEGVRPAVRPQRSVPRSAQVGPNRRMPDPRGEAHRDKSLDRMIPQQLQKCRQHIRPLTGSVRQLPPNPKSLTLRGAIQGRGQRIGGIPKFAPQFATDPLPECRLNPALLPTPLNLAPPGASHKIGWGPLPNRRSRRQVDANTRAASTRVTRVTADTILSAASSKPVGQNRKADAARIHWLKRNGPQKKRAIHLGVWIARMGAGYLGL